MERRGTKGLRLVLPAVLAVTVLAAGPIAAAQTTGEIKGTVVTGTDEKPAADVEVTLESFSVEASLGTQTATTDAKGRFSFSDLPEGIAGFQLSATYQDAVFRSPATGFTAGQTTEQTLKVWTPTTDPGAVTLTDYIVWIDRENDGVAVQHDFSWTNGTDTAYVGSDPSSIVSVPLPQGVSNLQFLGTFLETPGDVAGQTYVSAAPIVPGTSTATLRYNAPPLTSMKLELPFATTSLQVFVPQDVKLTAKALRLSGTVTDKNAAGELVTYQVYAADNVAAGTTIDVAMSQGEAPSSSSNAAMWILLVVGGLVLLGALVTLLVRRSSDSRGRSTATRTGARPMRAKARAVEPRANGHAAPARALDTGNGPEPEGEDPELIVEEIAALDLSFDRGLLDERTYKRLRVAAKDRLLRAEGTRAKGGRAR